MYTEVRFLDDEKKIPKATRLLPEGAKIRKNPEYFEARDYSGRKKWLTGASVVSFSTNLTLNFKNLGTAQNSATKDRPDATSRFVRLGRK